MEWSGRSQSWGCLSGDLKGRKDPHRLLGKIHPAGGTIEGRACGRGEGPGDGADSPRPEWLEPGSISSRRQCPKGKGN